MINTPQVFKKELTCSTSWSLANSVCESERRSLFGREASLYLAKKSPPINTNADIVAFSSGSFYVCWSKREAKTERLDTPHLVVCIRLRALLPWRTQRSCPVFFWDFAALRELGSLYLHAA